MATAETRKRSRYQPGEALPDLLEGCDPQPAAKALVEKLKRVDLVPLLRQLQSERGLPLEAAKAHIQELLRFLVLKALARDGEERGSKLTLSPSFLVDQAWHELLLRPRLYADVCSALGCAHVIDHDPLGGKDPERPKRLARTKAAYSAVFGVDPPAATWDEAPRSAAAARTAAVPADEPEATTPGAAPAAKPPSEKLVTLKLKDANGMVVFKVRTCTMFEKIMDAYGKKNGVNPAFLRFLAPEAFHILPHQTVEDAGLECGDTIEVYQDQIGC